MVIPFTAIVDVTEQQEAHQVVGQEKHLATKIRSTAAGIGIFGRFSNFDKCRSEVARDVMAALAAPCVSMNIRSTFREYGANSGRIS